MKSSWLTQPISRSARVVLLHSSVVLAVATGAADALAQQSTQCSSVQPLLLQRKAISEKLTASSKGKQIDAKVACAGFGQLVANGQAVMKWLDANKTWCQVPDSFAESMKTDHGRAVTIRAKACGVAAKQVQMEKQAREGSGSGAGGLLGGPGLTGQNKLPQGAL